MLSTYRFRKKTRFGAHTEFDNGTLLCTYLNLDLSGLKAQYLALLGAAQTLASCARRGGLPAPELFHGCCETARAAILYIDALVLSNPPYNGADITEQQADPTASKLSGLAVPEGLGPQPSTAEGALLAVFDYYLSLCEGLLRVSYIYAPYLADYYYSNGMPHSPHDTVYTYNAFLEALPQEKAVYRFHREEPITVLNGHSILHERDEQGKEFLILWESNQYRHIGDFLNAEFSDVLRTRLLIKKCVCCGRFFVINSRYSTDYCENIAPGETERTCREIGAQKTYHHKVASDPVWSAYHRAYKAHYARIAKKKMTKQEFLAWADNAIRLRGRMLAHEMKFDDYVAQLKQ